MIQRILTLLFAAGFAAVLRAQDLMPVSTPADTTHQLPQLSCDAKPVSTAAHPIFSDDEVEDDSLSLDNLCRVLDRYEVKFKRIVAAQAILETGNFSSSLCKRSHNLFGLRRPSDGSYYEFSSWQESVKAYRDYVQYKYSSGDYYSFLNRIGYAEDRQYTTKVRRIADGLPI